MPISDEDRKLLEDHAPQLRYHPREAYRADSAATFTEAFSPGRHSNELHAKSGKLIAQVRPTAGRARLSLATLAPSGQDYFPGGDKAGEGDYLLGHAKTLREDWQAARALPGLADRVYCRIADGTEGRRWLQYWLFFYDNPFKRFGFGQHQGDWEWIQIALVNGKPDCSSYSQHGQSESREWPKVPTVRGKGVVPVVYVAKDSHALYYKADEHTRIFGIANDHTADGGVVLRPEPYILDEDGEDDWVHWPGTWGPEGSPTGPPWKTAWTEPEAFHADRVKRGLLAGLEAPAVPAEPELAVTLDEDTAVVSYTLAARAPGRSDPARLELALYGTGDRPVPSVTVTDITEARGQVRVPLPYDEGPYTLQAAVYDAEDQETLLAPIDVAVPRGAGLEAPARRVLRPEPGGRKPVALTEVALIATAPSDDDANRVTLEQAARRADVLGPSVQIASLFNGDDPALRRHFVVRGAPTEAPGTDVAASAFEAARQLQATLPAEWEIFADPPGAAATPRRDGQEAALGGGDDPHDWAIEELFCRQAWVLDSDGGAAQGAGIVIAQPDTGFTDHPELELGALDRLRDYDVLTDRDDAHAVLRGFPPLAFPSHGTGTASVAVSREAGDITGAAPQATIVPIRAAESVIHVRNAELALAVERACQLGADVITISMGGVLYPPALQEIIARAVAAGTIVMAAAGQFVGLVVWPARFPECLAVGGSARFGKPWRWSSKGSEVDISAPAKDVWVAATRKEGADPFHIAQHDGTSFAAALTAGVAALWLAHHGGRKKVAAAVGGEPNVQAAFRALVRRECTKPDDWDSERRGAGLVNAEKLLAADLASWSDVEDEPSQPRTDAEGRALEAAAVMAPDDVDGEERMVALFGGDRDRLARFGDEVVYRMAEDQELRDAVLSAPGAALEASGPALLRAVASPSLRDALARAP